MPKANSVDRCRYNTILVITCYYTKIALLVAITKKLQALDFAQLLYKHIEACFRTLEGIVSDRDKLFTSNFWAEFC